MGKTAAGPYLGDFSVGSTIAIMWNAVGDTFQSITRATDGAIRVYKDLGLTQRTSTAGQTDSEDFDTLTGLNGLAIDTSDNTDAGFYAAGHDYHVVLQGAIIDGDTLNVVLASFSIENRSTFRRGAVLTEPAAAPTWSSSFEAQLAFLIANCINPHTVTSSSHALKTAAGAALSSNALSDDGVTFTSAKAT